MKRFLFILFGWLLGFSTMQSQSVVKYHYWYDQDASNMQSGFLGNGNLILDANGLDDGLHSLYVMLEGDAMMTPQRYIFLKLSTHSLIAELQCHYWYDDDVSNMQSNLLSDGVLVLNTDNLDDGLHSLYIVLEGDAMMAPQRYLFLKMSQQSSSSTADLRYRYWYDDDISNIQDGLLGGCNLLLDANNLVVGDHTLHFMLDGNCLMLPQSYDFTKSDCSPYFFEEDTVLCNVASYNWHEHTFTESGIYYDSLQTVNGCDSIFQLSLELYNTPLGEFTYMTPTDNYPFTSLPITFTWDAVSGAEYYDLYMWDADEEQMPEQPFVSDLSYGNYSTSSLQNNHAYYWFVKARNKCNEVLSSVMSFSLDVAPSLIVDVNHIDFGEVTMNESTSTTLNVTGNHLEDTLIVQITGEDAALFSFELENDWDDMLGGHISVTCHPTLMKSNFSAFLIISSGTVRRTVLLTSSMSNQYVFSTNVEGDVFSTENEIVITGHVQDISGNAVAGLDVDVYLLVMGTRITFTAISDAAGDYNVVYHPRYSESGYYEVGSCLKNMSGTAVHDTFDIPGMCRVTDDFIIWDLFKNDTLAGAVTIRNRSGIPLNNIHVNPISLPEGCSVDFTEMDLEPFMEGQLQYVVMGTEVSTGNKYKEISFEIVSDNGTTLLLTSYYYCHAPRGIMDVYPRQVDATMRRGDIEILSFMVTNRGNDESGPITIILPDAEWMSVLGEPVLESLQVGDSCTFSVMLTPDADMELGQYQGEIFLYCTNTPGVSIPFVLEATSEVTGVLVVDVTDDYTYNTNGGNGPHLANASVVLTNVFSLETVFERLTGQDGTVTIEDVPEGYYYLTVEAESHKNVEDKLIYVKAGGSRSINYEQVYLQFMGVSYTWVVIPTEIEDEYEFELLCEIQTNVPVPVITIDCPKEIDSLDYGESSSFNIIMTNHGLIDAYESRLTISSQFGDYVFNPLYDYIDTLRAKTSVVIPCTVTRLQNTRNEDEICGPIILSGTAFYYCNSDKKWVPYNTTLFMVAKCRKIIEPIIPLDRINIPDLPAIPEIIPCIGCGPTHVKYDTGGGTKDKDCTPCWKIPAALAIQLIMRWTNANDLMTDLSVCNVMHSVLDVDELLDLVSCAVTAVRDWALAEGVEWLAGSEAKLIFNIVMSIRDVVDKLKQCITFENPNRELLLDLDAMTDQLEQIANYLESYGNLINNVFQEQEWQDEEHMLDFLNNFMLLIDDSNHMLSPENAELLKGACVMTNVNDSIIDSFVERWNNSVFLWGQGIFLRENLPESYEGGFVELSTHMLLPAQVAIESADAYGFDDIGEMTMMALGGLADAAYEHGSDVCAKVIVQFKQTMTMTREAFEGTLELTNGHPSDPIQNIDIDVVIKDSDGVVQTELFQINVVTMEQILDINGSGTLDAQQKGKVRFEMIPTIEAAPIVPKEYSFGGTITYLDPFSSEIVTYELFPVELTVNPGPNLYVDYFVQRHIISDDPLTTDTIEPTEPAMLAMMIRNVGEGNANNVYLKSSQPTIVENEHGLLIQFDLVGAAMNGIRRPLGLTDIPFGTIESHSAGIAEWYFTSSLLGRVTASTPRFIHNNSNGNQKLSLVTEIHSHELTKAIAAYGTLDDSINDFLVNETVDFNHTPDKIYFSHGGTANVRKVLIANTDGVVSNENNTVLLSINPITAGWNYACVDDPGQGLYEIISCTRSDGQVIPLSNVWISHVTMLDEGAPVHENKLHIVDTLAVNQATTYTLVYGEAGSAATTMQSMSLTQGWNWWSTYVEMNNVDGLSMLENSLGHKGVTIKSQFDFVQNFYSDYGEDVWFGSLEGITNEQGYMINVTEDCTSDMRGLRTRPTSHPITLQPNWNWIGYPVDMRQGIASALAGFNASPDDLVKSHYEFSVYYDGFGWFPDDFIMTPGEGYFYYSNAPASQILTYNNGRGATLPQKSDKRMWKTDVHAFADNLSVMAVVSIDSVEQRDEDLELGAFVDGECRGSARLKRFGPFDRYYAMLSVSGQEGDKVVFGFVNKEKGQNSMASDNHLAFVRNDIVGSLGAPYIVRFDTKKEASQEDFMVLFPNPVERGKTFSLEIPKDETLKEVVIVDMLGEEILRKTGALKPNEMEGLPVASIYVVKATTQSGKVYHGRLIVK